jgi:hypothetical protein
MNRTYLLAAGVVMWVVAGVDFFAHLKDGDLLAPAAMAAVFVAWFGLRVVPARLARATVAASDPAQGSVDAA